jgi:hypothetical protein
MKSRMCKEEAYRTREFARSDQEMEAKWGKKKEEWHDLFLA